MKKLLILFFVLAGVNCFSNDNQLIFATEVAGQTGGTAVLATACAHGWHADNGTCVKD